MKNHFRTKFKWIIQIFMGWDNSCVLQTRLLYNFWMKIVNLYESFLALGKISQEKTRCDDVQKTWNEEKISTFSKCMNFIIVIIITMSFKKCVRHALGWTKIWKENTSFVLFPIRAHFNCNIISIINYITQHYSFVFFHFFLENLRFLAYSNLNCIHPLYEWTDGDRIIDSTINVSKIVWIIRSKYRKLYLSYLGYIYSSNFDHEKRI